MPVTFHCYEHPTSYYLLFLRTPDKIFLRAALEKENLAGDAAAYLDNIGM